MTVVPVITEKTLAAAKKGKYTFFVPVVLTKYEAKAAIESAFGVHVKSVKTAVKATIASRSALGKKKSVKSAKRVTVTLADKEKIDLFEEKK